MPAFRGQGVPPPRRPQPSCVAAPSLRGVTLVSVCSLCLHFVFSFGFTNLVLIFLFACLFASELHYPVDLIVDEIMSLVGVDSLFVAICFCMNCLVLPVHPDCSCKATFPFLPSTRRLLDALDFVLVNLSSFDVCDMRDMTDESCDEGNVCFIYLSSCQLLPKKNLSEHE